MVMASLATHEPPATENKEFMFNSIMYMNLSWLLSHNLINHYPESHSLINLYPYRKVGIMVMALAYVRQ